jgi:hypothetical protein
MRKREGGEGGREGGREFCIEDGNQTPAATGNPIVGYRKPQNEQQQPETSRIKLSELHATPAPSFPEFSMFMNKTTHTLTRTHTHTCIILYVICQSQ